MALTSRRNSGAYLQLGEWQKGGNVGSSRRLGGLFLLGLGVGVGVGQWGLVVNVI